MPNDNKYTKVWREKMKKLGRCRQCGQPSRVKNGRTLSRCLPCQKKQEAINGRLKREKG